MLEPLEPTNCTPATPGDGGPPSEARTAAEALAAAGVTKAIEVRGTGQASDSAAGDESDASAWNSDWLQLSHELRTPLNAILGNIELLLDGSAGPLAAPARACIGDIQVASRQLLKQLQPLLLLIQARTSAALKTRLPLDLLALVREAATKPTDPVTDRTCGIVGDGAVSRSRGMPILPEGIRLMLPGDPVWLGALAAALVDLHALAPGTNGPLTVELAQGEEREGGVMMRASWTGLDPASAGPLPLALIDAVLALHGGRIRALSPDGLWLDLPLATVASSRLGQGAR